MFFVCVVFGVGVTDSFIWVYYLCVGEVAKRKMGFREAVFEELDARLNKLTEKIRKHELERAELDGRFWALFNLRTELNHHPKFREGEKE